MNVLGSHLASPNLCSGRWKHLVKENWRQATWNQCCGSGSDPYVFGPYGSASHKYVSGSGSFHHQAKIIRKTLISPVFWLLYDFLTVFRIGIRMLLGLPDPLDRGTDPDDPHPVTYQNATDPQLCLELLHDCRGLHWKDNRGKLIFVLYFVIRLRLT